MKKLLVSIILAFASTLGWSQVAVISGQVLSINGGFVPFAKIRVCSVTSSGTPCNPTVPVYYDYGLNNIATNPTADQYGNYLYYGPALSSPNIYIVQVIPQAGTTWMYAVNGPSISSGGGTLTGPLTDLFGFIGPLIGNVTGNVTGNLTGNVTGNLTGTVTGIVSPTLLSPTVTPPIAPSSAGWVCWGDSQTAGYQGNLSAYTGAYCADLVSLIGPLTVNQGRGGQTSHEIAISAGAEPAAFASVSGSSIPACASLPCSGVTVTFASGTAPIIAQGSPPIDYNFVTGSAQSTPPVHGTLSVTTDGSVYTFTPSQVGSSAIASGTVPFTIDTPYAGYSASIWMGRNNILGSGGFNGQAQILTDYNCMIKGVAGGGSCIGSGVASPAVIGMLYGNNYCSSADVSAGNCTSNQGSEWTGTVNRTTVSNGNTAISAAYPSIYIDPNATITSAYLTNPAVCGFTFTTDASDIANGVIPSACRAIYSTGTITSAINSSTCTIPLALNVNSLPPGLPLIIDGEEIIPLSSTPPDGSIMGTATINTCIRGYAGTAASHLINASWTVTDTSHLNAGGQSIMATAASAKALMQNSSVMSLRSLQSYLAQAVASPTFLQGSNIFGGGPGVYRQRIAGNPSSGLQLVFGNPASSSTVTNTIGTFPSSSSQIQTFNAIPPSPFTANWHIPYSGAASELTVIDAINGLAYYHAGAGTTDGSFTHVWGSTPEFWANPFGNTPNPMSAGTILPWVAPSLNAAPTPTPFTGTSGTASCSQGLQGTQKYASCYLNGYANTGAAQTWTFSTAFSTTPVLFESGGSCGTYNPSSTATVLTLPANAGMTAETCNVIVLGQ